MTLRSCLVALFCMLGVHAACAATRADRARSETVSYVLASELGSGIYDFGGRSLQVYRFAPGWSWREAAPGQPGVRLVLPLTFGFLDFDPLDIPGEGLPSRVDSFGLTPGIELDFVLAHDWTLTTWARTGFSVVSGGVDGWLYGTGAALHRESEWQGRQLYRRHELAFAGAHFGGNIPDDRYLRLRQAAELRQGTGYHWRGRELEVGAYGILDFLPDPPSAPGTDDDGEPVRVEMGVMLGTRPGLKYRRIPIPRLGLGYRFAGEFSGWHLAIGAPF